MQPDLDTVIQQKVRALPLSLQEEVLQYVERISFTATNTPENEGIEREVTKRLIAHGLIDSISSPFTDDDDSEIELIEVQGEDLSKIIVRERR